jgi:Helix-turn-helix domain
MATKTTSDLTVREVAELTGAAIPTVTLWCREKRFPNAHQEETPRGPVWYIPKSDLEGVEMRGRGRPAKPKHPADTTRDLNTAFKKATESDGKAGKKAAQRRGRKGTA